MEKSTTKLLPPFFNGEKAGQAVVGEVLRALDIRRGMANVVDERMGERYPCPSKKRTVVSKTFMIVINQEQQWLGNIRQHLVWLPV